MIDKTKFRNHVRATAEMCGWSLGRWGDNGDAFWRDGEQVDATYDADGTLTKARSQYAEINLAVDTGPHPLLERFRAPRCATPLQRLHNHIDTYDDSEPNYIPCDIVNDTFFEDGAVTVKLGSFENGFSLWWFDGVINEITEYHPTLSTALARLAALIYCGEHDWAPAFNGDAGEFHNTASLFFKAATS